eukprot:7232891-Heterocapsa_arctica.AAC.1
MATRRLRVVILILGARTACGCVASALPMRAGRAVHVDRGPIGTFRWTAWMRAASVLVQGAFGFWARVAAVHVDVVILLIWHCGEHEAATGRGTDGEGVLVLLGAASTARGVPPGPSVGMPARTM